MSASCKICEMTDAWCAGTSSHLKIELDTSPPGGPYREGSGRRRVYIRVTARSSQLPRALEELRAAYPPGAVFQYLPICYSGGRYLSETLVIVETP